MSLFVLFLLSLLLGIVLGVVYGAVGILKIIFKNNIVVSNILDFIFAILSGVAVIFFVVNFNFGVFRWFIVVGVLIGILLERKTLGKIFAKIFLLMYNKFSKCIIALKNTKVVKKILK